MRFVVPPLLVAARALTRTPPWPCSNSKFAAFALQARRYLCCRERDAFGTASESYLHGLVSRYSQIIDNLAVVVVFGSVYPMVVPAGLLALLGRTYADTRLVRKVCSVPNRVWAVVCVAVAECRSSTVPLTRVLAGDR